MSGSAFLGLILLSMAWLYFLAGLIAHYHLFLNRKRRRHAPAPTRFAFLPGVVGSLAVLFSIPLAVRYGIEVPWPWLWILLPLLIDPYCLPGFVRALLQKR